MYTAYILTVLLWKSALLALLTPPPPGHKHTQIKRQDLSNREIKAANRPSSANEISNVIFFAYKKQNLKIAANIWKVASCSVKVKVKLSP
jgi:hypothetical protein